MSKLNSAAFILALTTLLSAPAALAADKTEVEILELTPSSETLSYSIYESVSYAGKEKEVTTFIRISDAQDGAGLISLELALEVLESNEKEPGTNTVRTLSSLDFLKLGGQNPSGPVLMKTGTVKFFNESKGFGRVAGKKLYVGNLPFSATSVLVLPDELQKFVSEARPQAPRENRRTVIIFEVQEGKKGLNAVNVKKA